MIFSDGLLSDPDFAEMYRQHLQWCYRHKPPVEMAEQKWTSTYNVYRRRAAERQQRERQERESERQRRYEEEARQAEAEEYKKEQARQAEVKKRKAEEKEPERQKVDYQMKFGKSLLDDPLFEEIYEKHLQWCYQNLPLAEDAKEAWIIKYKDYQKRVATNQEAARLRRAEKEVREKRERQKADLQEDLALHKREFEVQQETPSVIVLQNAEEDLGKLRREKNALEHSADHTTHVQVIKLRCLILEQKCNTSKINAAKELAALNTPLVSSKTKSRNSNEGSGGAVVGAIVGGVIGLMGGFGGVLAGAALGGAIGAGMSGSQDVSDSAEHEESVRKRSKKKRDLQEWEDLIAQIETFLSTIDDKPGNPQ